MLLPELLSLHLANSLLTLNYINSIKQLSYKQTSRITLLYLRLPKHPQHLNLKQTQNLPEVSEPVVSNERLNYIHDNGKLHVNVITTCDYLK